MHRNENCNLLGILDCETCIIKIFLFYILVPFQEVPKYNDKRRPNLAGTIGLHRSRSDPRLNVAGFHSSKPPSPALSNSSLPQYISNGNLFEASSAGMLFRRNYDSDSPRSMSISDTGSCSGLSGVYYIEVLPLSLNYISARNISQI